MPTAEGFVDGVSTTGLRAVFALEGEELLVTFSSSINPAIKKFRCSDATLDYSNRDDLYSSRDWAGHIGWDKILIKFSRGITISGTLDMPVHPASHVLGAGTWSHKFRQQRDTLPPRQMRVSLVNS